MSLFPTIYSDLTINGENLVILYAREKNTKALSQLTSGKPEALNDCIYGYAWGKHHEEVQKLLTENASLASYAVRGYARAGDGDMVIKLIAKYPETQKDAVYGYAQAGNISQVSNAFNSTKSNIYNLPAILGSASTNQTELLKKALQGFVYTRQAIQAAAKNGHSSMVNDLLENAGINLKKKLVVSLNNPLSISQFSHLNNALQSYVEGCHFAEAGRLIDLGANPAYAILALNRHDTITVEDAHAVLAHINDQSARTETLTVLLKNVPRLKSSDFNPEKLEEINAKIQSGAHYLQATKAECKQTSGSISVSMLSQLFLSEDKEELQEKHTGISFH